MGLLTAAVLLSGCYFNPTKPNKGAAPSEKRTVFAFGISSLPTNPYYSNDPTLEITGGCNDGATLTLTGDDVQTEVCGADNAFDITITEGPDGEYDYNILAEDPLVGNQDVDFTWVLDTVAPATPAVSEPTTNPYVAGGATMAVSGSCEPFSTVSVTGDASTSTTCTEAGAYSLAIPESTDGVYSYQVSQTDRAGNTSASTTIIWDRNTAVPTAPTIINPAENPFHSSGSALTITGGCESGFTVTLSGASSQTTSCVLSAYSFTVNKTTDNLYNFSVTQTNPANGFTSPPASFWWDRDTAAPSAIAITSPATSPFTSSANSLTITGTCETGARVTMSGDASQQVTCTLAAFSVSVTKTSDGTYTFNFVQTDLANNASPSVSQQWIRATNAPAAPTITTPAANPFHSNGSNLTISGGCTTGLTVRLSGASTQSTSCSSSAYSFSVSKTSDGTYDFEVKQESAGGVLSAPVARRWIRDVSIVPITLLTPASSPHSSSETTLNIAGICEPAANVVMSGAGTGSMTCTGIGTFAFTSTKVTDGTYNYSFTQTDLAGNASTAVPLQWIKSVAATPPPTITSPASSPHKSNASSLTIAGACVTGYPVSLSGDSTQSTTCASSAYSFSVSKSLDGTYNFQVTQTNPGNSLVSSPVAVTWVRDTAAPAAITLTSPSQNPYTSGESSVTLSGTCETGATVALGGAGTQSATCASSAFSFTISQSVDGGYDYTLTQTDAAGNASTPLAFRWNRETSTPASPTFTSPATSPYYSNGSSLTIAGGCTTGNLVQLAGADSQAMTCTSSAYSFTVSKTVDGTYLFSVTQRNPSNNNVSAEATRTWIRDATAPGLVTVTTPSSNPYSSGDTTITIAGACETNATVYLTGADTQQILCSDSAYSFTATKEVDGTYSYYLSQTDRASNSSGQRLFQWTRDTSVPAAPTITIPAVSPYASNSASLTISGGCTTGLVVKLSGDDVQTTVCAVAAYSFTVNKSTNATFAFAVQQQNPANQLISDAATQVWIRDTLAPAAPTVTNPGTNPFKSGDTTIQISGACESGAAVTMSGASAGTTTCTGGTFAFSSTKTSDGTYTYTLIQTDPAGNASPTTTFEWQREVPGPSTPVITSPSTNPYYSNTAGLVIGGACQTGLLVILDDGENIQQMTCASSLFSFTVSSATDGIHNITLLQKDTGTGGSSDPAVLTWVQDRVGPAPPVIRSPGDNPFSAADTNLTMRGTCESGNTVNMTGAGTGSTVCVKSVFALSTTQTTNGVYDFSFTQTDRAGNVSTPAVFKWIRDSAMLPTPYPTSPSTNPVYSTATSLTISGPCGNGTTIYLTGADTLTTSCSQGLYSFAISKTTDGVFDYSVKQANTSTGVESARATISWIRDATPPAVVDSVNPILDGTGNYASADTVELEGGCEKDVDVEVSGDSTQSISCADETYKMTVSKPDDGTYVMSVRQKDQAGNQGTTKTVQWTKDKLKPSTPKILVPAKSPFLSNSSTITISGTCKTGNPVYIAGDVTAGQVLEPAGSLVMTCTEKKFAFTVQKTSDGTYNFSIKQAFGTRDSGTHARKWIRDTTAPNTSIATAPASTNLSLNAEFTFSANETGGYFECSLDGAAYVTCASPARYTSLTNASHTFAVRAVDKAGNVGSAVSHSWTQQAAMSIALWHFDTFPGTTIDSGLFSGANHNDLTPFGTGTTATGKFAQAATFNGTSGYMSVSDRPSHTLLNETMTIDAFVKFTSPPANGSYATIASKSNGTGQVSWELKIKRLGSNWYLIFVGSQDGTSSTEVKSVQLPSDTVNFHHYAVTWNKGSVKFFYDGVVKGTGSIGTSGAKLFTSNADIRIGRSNSGEYLPGVIDELRLSQIVRWNAGFTPTNAAYSAD